MRSTGQLLMTPREGNFSIAQTLALELPLFYRGLVAEGGV